MNGVARLFTGADGPDEGGGSGQAIRRVFSAQGDLAAGGASVSHVAEPVFQILHVEDDAFIARIMNEVLGNSIAPGSKCGRQSRCNKG